MFEEFIEKFNEVFEGDAKAEIKSNDLIITIKSRTINISLPGINGASAMGS